MTKNAQALTDLISWISDDRKDNYYFIGKDKENYRFALVKGIAMLLREIERNQSEE